MTFNVFDDPQQWKTLSNYQDLAQLPAPIVISDDDDDSDSDSDSDSDLGKDGNYQRNCSTTLSNRWVI